MMSGRTDHPWGSFILTFPFWIYTTRSPALPAKVVRVHGGTMRLFAPFRSGPANYLPMPVAPLDAIPFPAPGRSPLPAGARIMRIAAVPPLDRDAEGKAQIVLAMKPSWGERPDPFPMDSLRLDIEGAYADLGTASSLARLVLRGIRVQTKQWWITRSADALTTYVQLGWGTDAEGAVRSEPEPYTSGRAVYGFEQSLDPQRWDTAVCAFETGEPPSLADELLLDAFFHAAAGDLGSAIMAAAVGCENAAGGLAVSRTCPYLIRTPRRPGCEGGTEHVEQSVPLPPGASAFSLGTVRS